MPSSFVTLMVCLMSMHTDLSELMTFTEECSVGKFPLPDKLSERSSIFTERIFCGNPGGGGFRLEKDNGECACHTYIGGLDRDTGKFPVLKKPCYFKSQQSHLARVRQDFSRSGGM